MKLKELYCVLVLYHQNFRNLHWNSVGENFDDAHKEIAKDYYEMTDDTIDTVAEMMGRLGVNPPNYAEVFNEVSNSSNDYMVVESTELYDRTAIVKMSDKMLTDITALLAATIQDQIMQEPINAGMRSELETILNDYDIQARYINKRKLGCCSECGGGQCADHAAEFHAHVQAMRAEEPEEPFEDSSDEGDDLL